MREVKFRAWNKEWGMMSFVDLIDFEFQSINVTVKASDYDHKKEWSDYQIGKDIILMQYTGLKDKKGLMIFEGDIVLLPNNAGELEKRTIVYNRGAFELVYKNYPAKTDTLWRTPKIKSIEIIGNIYNNKEVLK